MKMDDFIRDNEIEIEDEREVSSNSGVFESEWRRLFKKPSLISKIEKLHEFEIRSGSVHVLTAPFLMGLTSLALNIVIEEGVYEHVPIRYFSLDQPKTMLSERLALLKAELPINLLNYKHDLRNKEWDRINSAIKDIAGKDIEFYYEPLLTVDLLIEYMKYCPKGSIVFIDEIGMLSMQGEKNLRKIVYSLKNIALEYDVSIIGLYGINSPRFKSDHWLLLSSYFREVLRPGTDSVWVLHRDDYYYQGRPKRRAKLICVKPLMNMFEVNLYRNPEIEKYSIESVSPRL